ncbi:MAG: histidine phosphatase family protein [Clostridiales bacterium]|uniref:histidine phosphatase family protein n=1 Tax=Clostridium sp. N3C TaxID=1776758 RepID=UPI00092DFCF8|nr:histidine phosphatase family protein [Clostridium sp. N3C]NLZ47982.1 histidine phosphatase family protein [Clostridiales bacterium]SCN24435.1 putative phosphoserine phosphatase 2 [Clostridium sp. N3C]
MIKELLIIRHGEDESTKDESLTGGWTNSALTLRGKRQAEATGERLWEILRGKEFDFFCSDLDNAWQTAEIIGRCIHKKPMVFGALRELCNGSAANLTKKEAESLLNPISEPVWDWIPYPNAESWKMFNNRVFNFMDSINDTAEERVLIVTHSGTAIAIICWWLELEEAYKRNISFDIDLGSISRLRINESGEKTISSLNDTSHLYGSAIEPPTFLKIKR